MTAKLLANLATATVVLFVFYRVFYFRLVPRLVAYYRKVVGHRRQYDREIEAIQKEDIKERGGDAG